MLEWKKKQFWNPWKISYKMYKIFFPFSFSFSIENEKNELWPPFAPIFPPFWGVLVPLAPLKIWDVMPPYLKTLFEQKQKFDNFDHFRPDDPLKLNVFSLYVLSTCCLSKAVTFCSESILVKHGEWMNNEMKLR